jgi:hypothetical protein
MAFDRIATNLADCEVISYGRKTLGPEALQDSQNIAKIPKGRTIWLQYNDSGCPVFW